jgi:hypothetical protein
LLTWIEGCFAVAETVKWSHMPACTCPGTPQTKKYRPGALELNPVSTVPALALRRRAMVFGLGIATGATELLGLPARVRRSHGDAYDGQPLPLEVNPRGIEKPLAVIHDQNAHRHG